MNKLPRLYGITEIARELDVYPDLVSMWKKRGKLPPPDAVLAMGPVWTARTIEPFIRQEQRG